MLPYFAGTWNAAAAPLRVPVGQWGDAWPHRCHANRPGPALSRISVPLPVRRVPLEVQTARQVTHFLLLLLANGFRTVRLTRWEKGKGGVLFSFARSLPRSLDVYGSSMEFVQPSCLILNTFPAFSPINTNVDHVVSGVMLPVCDNKLSSSYWWGMDVECMGRLAAVFPFFPN